MIGRLSILDPFIEGDLHKNPTWDIWFDPEAFSHNRKFSTDQSRENCVICDKASDCKGGCSALSFCETGMFNNNPYCYNKMSRIDLLDASKFRTPYSRKKVSRVKAGSMSQNLSHKIEHRLVFTLLDCHTS